MSDFIFKQVDKNEYETFMEGNSLNIFFKIPDGCKIEDYNIKKAEETPTLVGTPSKAAYFEFIKAPDEETASFISPLAGDESSNGVIKNADIRYSDLKNINGILTNDLFNCKADNVTFEKESYIKYGSLTRDVKGRWLELENVVLKEQASLYLYDYSNQESPLKKFSNSTIEGKVEIDNDVNYTIESSILKSGNMKIKAGDKIDKVVIDNSILEGDNVLYNVSELSCSEVRDSELDLKEPAKISNQLLSFEDIDDYEAYQRAQEPKLEEIKKDVGQITTEDWEVL